MKEAEALDIIRTRASVWSVGRAVCGARRARARVDRRVSTRTSVSILVPGTGKALLDSTTVL